MKKSELKALIREVINTIGSTQPQSTDEEVKKLMAQLKMELKNNNPQACEEILQKIELLLNT
jgi:hypothetical protein